jgi:ABC-type cobalamin transport system ATPase subunit
VTDETLRLVNRKLRTVAETVNGNAAECVRLAAQVNQHGATMNNHAAVLARLQAVQQIEVAAIEALDRKLERILKKLERRDD